MSTLKTLQTKAEGFGTTPVFMATISTILGAILFLRFGYAVAHVGFWGTIGIIVLGHVVTIATAMAVAEIATNQVIKEGGAYYIVSRAFGLNIGAAIGIALYAAQAISVAFYVIAFAESFAPLEPYFLENYGLDITDKRIISIPVMIILAVLILLKGANLGIKALYVVVAILFLSIIMFFMGGTDYVPTEGRFLATVENPDNFFYVFTIIFPAFTGIAAGLGLSGDLKDPKKSIPMGTLSATFFGMIVYVAIAYKLTISGSPDDLNNDQLFMAQVATWSPIIPIGLACAALSSALGSIMVAPRTLQALGLDEVFPIRKFNAWFSKGRAKDGEPIISAAITCAIAFVFIGAGNINFVAEIISMFFMLTYGAICLISFLEHFVDDPYYRPPFKSKWYISLIGAILCIWLTFKMNFYYASVSIVIMLLTYMTISRFSKPKIAIANILKNAVTQLSWRTQVSLQKATHEREQANGDTSRKPSVICISKDSFKRKAVFDMLRWLSFKHGFGTYIHLVEGYLSKENYQKALEAERKMVKISSKVGGNVYISSLISPSYTSAIAQAIQLPGASGRKNNMFLFEFSKREPSVIMNIIKNRELIQSLDFDLVILGTSEKGFGYRRKVHIWITENDLENISIMTLLAFIVLGHPEWKAGDIKIWLALPAAKQDELIEPFLERLQEGKSPVVLKDIEVVNAETSLAVKTLINEESIVADLIVVGLDKMAVQQQNTEAFEGYDEVGNMLFVKRR